MNAMKSPPSARPARKERVAHIRFSADEICALEAAAARADLTVSAFVRSLSLEGAGVRPFLSEADRAIIELLGQGVRSISNNLNQLARAINAGQSGPPSDVAGRIDDARAIATTITAELAGMTRRVGAVRRGEAS